MKSQNKNILAVSLLLINIILIYFLYTASSISIVIRAVSAIVLLIVTGYIIQKTFSLQGGYGVYLLGGKKGLKTIDNISKRYPLFWDVMTVWGLTLGFGLLTYPLMKGKIDKRVYAFGIISLILMLLFVTPYLGNAFQFINLPQIQNAVSSGQQQQIGIATYATYAITIIAGFSGTIFLSLFLNTESILFSFAKYIITPSLGTVGSGISSQIPGVAPVIPGIDIPLIAGIASLAILLAIHEFSHGILARRAKVRLKSIGLLVFGWIPIGGYVEPDENIVKRLDSIKQTNIFSAGIAANFIATIFFFLLLFALINYVVPTAYTYGVIVTGTAPNYPANNIIPNGAQIIKWNNQPVTSVTSLENASSKDLPNETVTVQTTTNFYSFKAVEDPSNSSRGIIGVTVEFKPIITTTYAKTVSFLYELFALSMLLNFLVAVVNLLPIPGFDGWRIYKANIKNNKFVNFYAALIIIFLLINVLPWLIYL